MGHAITATLHTTDGPKSYDVEGVFFTNRETHGDTTKLVEKIADDDTDVLFVNAAAAQLLAVEIRDVEPS